MSSNDAFFRTLVGAFLTLSVQLGMPAARAAAIPDDLRSEGFSADDWKRLSAGEPVGRMSRSGSSAVSEAKGAVLVTAPWRQAFAAMGRLEEMPRYSSCLKAMEVLVRAGRAGRTSTKVRESHSGILSNVNYTLDYTEDQERREIRWKLDPGARNDVVVMNGSWRFFPAGDGQTILVYQITGSSRTALPSAIESYLADLMLPSYLKAVRNHVETAPPRGRQERQ